MRAEDVTCAIFKGAGPIFPSKKTTEQYLLIWVVRRLDFGSDGGLRGDIWVTYHPKRLTGYVKSNVYNI